MGQINNGKMLIANFNLKENDIQALRLNDKISRLVNLILLKNKARNESVEDTFLDLSVYGKIALVVMRGKWAK